MPKENVVVKTCDRCGYSVEHERGIKDYIPIEKDGFHTIITDKKLFHQEGLYLCNTCYTEYLLRIKSFMKYGVPYKDEK